MSQSQSQTQTRRRRARIVCVQCHDRKLKCDLEFTSRNGSNSCSSCHEAATVCYKRSSMRRARKDNASRISTEASSTQKNAYPVLRPLSKRDLQLQPDEGLQHTSPQEWMEDHVMSQHRTSSSTQPPGPQPQAISAHSSPSQSADQQPFQSRGAPQSHTSDAHPSERDPPTVSSEQAYLGDTGIMPIFAQEHRAIARSSQYSHPAPKFTGLDLPPLELQESFGETYFDYCWPWCPILDERILRSRMDESPSALLINALALLGTRIRPPIVQHAEAAEYYDRAKMLFYTDQENDPIVSLQSIMLFYWWAPRGPSLVHKDAAWWWTGLAIKYAQQLGLHREGKSAQDVGGQAAQGLRRRIWWTLFARERLTAICQGRPCTINPDDCNVHEPSLADFGPAPVDPRAHVFIQWIRLCDIIGRVGQHLSRNSEHCIPATLAQELIEWVRGLPDQLKLPIGSDRTRSFDRDVHKLHLPYLTTITILHMHARSQHTQQPLPEVYTTAISSASCVARIFKDILARGHIRFLGAIATWFVGVALVALLHTQQIERLAKSGAEDIRILRTALNELATLWPTATIFVRGFDRLKAFENLNDAGSQGQPNDSRNWQQLQALTGMDNATPTVALSDMNWMHGIDWHSYFPFMTAQTSPLLSEVLVLEHQAEDFLGDISWLDAPTVQLQNMFDPSDAFLMPSFMGTMPALWNETRV